MKSLLINNIKICIEINFDECAIFKRLVFMMSNFPFSVVVYSLTFCPVLFVWQYAVIR